MLRVASLLELSARLSRFAEQYVSNAVKLIGRVHAHVVLINMAGTVSRCFRMIVVLLLSQDCSCVSQELAFNSLSPVQQALNGLVQLVNFARTCGQFALGLTERLAFAAGVAAASLSTAQQAPAGPLRTVGVLR